MQEQTSEEQALDQAQAEAAKKTNDAANLKNQADKVTAPPVEAKKAMSIIDTQASEFLDPNAYIQIKGVSADFFRSGALPSAIQNVDQAIMVMQAGYEMGMKPVESMQSLTIVNGAISVWGKSVGKQLRRHGWMLKPYDEGFALSSGTDQEIADSQYCTVTAVNPETEEEYSETVTFKESRESGYTLDKNSKMKPGWKPGLNRRLKLRYDALDTLIKTYIPEVYGPTAGTAETLRDNMDGDVEVIETAKDRIRKAANNIKLAKGKVKVEDAETVQE